MTNDLLGNRLTMGGITYGWDCVNRMTSLSGSVTASYAYRADGMRVAKQTGGVTTLYRHDGQMGVEDVEVPNSGAATVTRYGLGARGVDLIERTNGSGTSSPRSRSTTPTATTWRASPARARGSASATGGRTTHGAWCGPSRAGATPSSGNARASGTRPTTSQDNKGRKITFK